MEKLGINLNLLLVQIVHFLLLLFILNKLLYKPIFDLFDRRKQRIADGLAEADRVRAEAATERATLEAQIAEERRTSQERLRTAVAQSEEAAKNRLAEAQAEADKLIADARTEAEHTRQQALSGLQSQVADLAMSATAKVLGEAVDEPKHRALIDRFLKTELGELA